MMKNNKFCIAMALLAFLPTNLSAQEYYTRNNDIIEYVAKEKATRMAKDDEEKNIYQDAIKKAFEEYWKATEIKTDLEKDSLDDIADKVKDLQGRKKTLEASLKSLRQKASDATNTEEEKEKLQDMVKHYEGVISHYRDDSMNIARQLEELNRNLALVDTFKQKKNIREENVKALARDIKEFCKKCSEKSLLDKDFFSEGNELIRQYSGNDQKIRENINKIKGYIDLSQAVQNADVQISGKYNAQNNTAAIKQIENTVTALQGLKVSLSQNQSEEYQDRQNLLRNHEKVKNSLTEFLKFIQNKYVMINNNEEKVETIELIRKHLSEDDEWKNLKDECKKYEKLKAALEIFEKLEGSIGGGKNGLINYVTGIKSNI